MTIPEKSSVFSSFLSSITSMLRTPAAKRSDEENYGDLPIIPPKIEPMTKPELAPEYLAAPPKYEPSIVSPRPKNEQTPAEEASTTNSATH
jgi:hypothetical protein